MEKEGFAVFSFFRIAFCGPIDCSAAVWGRIGWISCQVTFQEGFFRTLTYHCLCLGDRRGRFVRIYRCSSFGGRCAYIHRLFQRILLTCGVWSAYGSLIACASWTERLYVWEARGFTSTSLLHLHKSLFVPFSVLFLGQVIFPLFRVCLCVCCVYVCVCVVWWGSSLSFSLDRRGDGGSMARQQRSGRGAMARLQLRRCWIGWNDHRSGRKLPTLTYPATLNHHAL
jgi:hypothetical protein